MEKQIRRVLEIVRVVNAVETLEYYDKNHLHGSNKTRSEERQRLLDEAEILLMAVARAVAP